jgi:hypothetical protein
MALLFFEDLRSNLSVLGVVPLDDDKLYKIEFNAYEIFFYLVKSSL